MQLLGKFAALAGSLPAQGRVRAAGQVLVGRPPATAVTTYYAYCICYFFKNLSRYYVGCTD